MDREKMNPSLAKYYPLVDFLAEVCGKDTEVVLIDVADMDHSVVAISNGHISGRSVGSPASNIVLKIMKAGGQGEVDYLVNYRGVADDGKPLRSSTYFIRDDEHRIIGMLCVNVDTSKLDQLKSFFDSLPKISDGDKPDAAVERFKSSVEDIANDSIEYAIRETGIPPSRMSQDEKIAIVKNLNENGVFLLKGSISYVAGKLHVSEATIYRYLNGIKKNG
jgi:predicted transcriptional regulator YheO